MWNISESIKIHLKIAAPFPEKVDAAEVASMIPFGKVEAEVVPGGMTAKGMEAPSVGEGDTIVVVNVSLTVFVDI